MNSWPEVFGRADAEIAADKEKGPAEAATSPDQGPIQTPSKDQKMNSEKSSTAAPSAATVTHELAVLDLYSLSMAQLFDLYEALNMAAEVMNSAISAPKFTNKDASLNPAGTLLDRLTDHIFECATQVVAVAETVEPSDPYQSECRAFLLLRRETSSRSSLPEFAALASSLVARQSRVEFDAKRRAAA